MLSGDFIEFIRYHYNSCYISILCALMYVHVLAVVSSDLIIEIKLGSSLTILSPYNLLENLVTAYLCPGVLTSHINLS